MSDRKPEPMSNEEFKNCFDVLQKIGENARTIIYAFVLIYGALLLWSLNAIVYPSEQQRLGQIIQKDADVIKCLVSLESSTNIDANCTNELKDTSLDYRVRQDNKAFPESPGATKFDLSKIDSDYMQHEVQYQLDRSSDVARFNVPILGIASDRSWLWIVNIALGPLFYFLIRDSLTNVRYLLSNLYENSVNQPVRLILLSVTQIVSSSTQKIGFYEKGTGTAKTSSVAKFIVMCFVFSLPILVSGLLFYDWYQLAVASAGSAKCADIGNHAGIIVNFLCHYNIVHTVSDFFYEPEFIGGILTVPVFIFEVGLFLQICGLLIILFRLHDSILSAAKPA
jgi:hypothetical protein